jgi:hypothetical protein
MNLSQINQIKSEIKIYGHTFSVLPNSVRRTSYDADEATNTQDRRTRADHSDERLQDAVARKVP